MWLFNYFHFEKNYEALKSKSPCILFNKKTNDNKIETESKLKISQTVLEKRTLCFSSYKNHKLKMNCDELVKEKRGHIFCSVCFVLPKETFLTYAFYLNA